jgi:monofunctional biosynthetic peptidoglycan transglycosylase
VIISEDAGFYGHHGFDYDEIRNSFKENIAKGAFARGGSTISQQLSKNLFLSKDKSIIRKLKEFIITQRIEQTYKKNVILEKYLNVIELGPHVYGVKDGAQYYFQKTPAAVTPLEGAFLAFLLPNPEKYGVSFKKKELTPFARARLKDILYKMNYYKKITNDEYQQSLDQLASLFTPIPQMSDEPSVQDFENNPPKIDKGTFDLTEPPDTLDEVTPPTDEPSTDPQNQEPQQ